MTDAPIATSTRVPSDEYEEEAAASESLTTTRS